jgi:hypothetical protein
VEQIPVPTRPIITAAPISELPEAAARAPRLRSFSMGAKWTTHPKLHQRWMFGVDSEIVVLHIRDAGRDVIGLINCEPVETSGDDRTQNRQMPLRVKQAIQKCGACS